MIKIIRNRVKSTTLVQNRSGSATMEILNKDGSIVYKDCEGLLERWEEYLKELYDTSIN